MANCTITNCQLPLPRAYNSRACASQPRPTAHKPVERRRTPTLACVLVRGARQPLVFIATAPPALAQVVILARAATGPYSTRSIVLVGQRHVILSMACSATHPTVNVHLSPFQIVSRQMAQ